MARPREFDEATVVEAARDRFWDAGYAATSLNDLSAATGLGKTSLYGAFGDKHALYLRIFDEYSAAAVRGVAEELAARTRARSSGSARTCWRTRPRSACNPRGCLLARGTAELAGSDEAVADRARQAFRRARRASTRMRSRPPSAPATSPPTPTPTPSATCC